MAGDRSECTVSRRNQVVTVVQVSIEGAGMAMPATSQGVVDQKCDQPRVVFPSTQRSGLVLKRYA